MTLKLPSKTIDNPSFILITNSIKIISTVLISGAIVWELANLYVTINQGEVMSNLKWIFWVGRLALISHGIEALIAAYYAGLQNKNPFQYSIYTFFVGTVGLLELKIGQEGLK